MTLVWMILERFGEWVTTRYGTGNDQSGMTDKGSD